MKTNNNIKDNKDIYECETNYNNERIKLTIGKADKDVFIRSSYYGLKLTPNEIKLLTNFSFDSIDQLFNFIKNRFIKNQFKIKNITSNDLSLIIQTRDPINERYKEIELVLSENFENKEYIFKDLYYKNLQQNQNNNNMRNEIDSLNKEIQKLQNEMMNMKNLIQQFQQYQSFCTYNINNLNCNFSNIKNDMNIMNNDIYQLNSDMNNIKMNNNIKYNSFMNNNNLNNSNMNNNNTNFNTNNSKIENNNVYNMSTNTSELNSQIQDEKDISVIFKNDKLIGNPIKINCSENDLISSLIEKFYTKWTCGKGKKRDNRYKFAFKGRKLNEQMTIREAGITIKDNKIFIVNKFDIIFKLYDGSHIKVQINNDELVSDIIKKFLNKSGYESKDIKSYIFGDCPLYENMTVGETQLQDNSIVFVIVKKKIEKISISLLDRSKSIGDTINNIDCPINFKVSALFDKSYKKIIVFDDKKLDEDLTFKEAGITDNSKIYYITDDIISIKLRNESWNYGNCKKFLEIDISIYESIFYLKQLYFVKSGGDISRKFYFDSKELDDNLTVKECGLMNNSKIIVCE